MFGWLQPHRALRAQNEFLLGALEEALDTADAAFDLIEELEEDRKRPYCMWGWISPNRIRTKWQPD